MTHLNLDLVRLYSRLGHIAQFDVTNSLLILNQRSHIQSLISALGTVATAWVEVSETVDYSLLFLTGAEAPTVWLSHSSTG